MEEIFFPLSSSSFSLVEIEEWDGNQDGTIGKNVKLQVGFV